MLFGHSVVSNFVTPGNAACQAFLSFTNSQSLLKFKSTESVIPSNHLIPCLPLLFLPSIFPSIRVFAHESVLCIKWSNYWCFSFSISPFNEYSGLISFMIDWFNLLTVQGTQESSLASQFESISSSERSLLYGLTLTSIHDCWKTPQVWRCGSLLAKLCLCFLICCLGLSLISFQETSILNIKRNTFESVLMRWMNLDPIIQGEVIQKDKNKYCILMHIHGI